MNLIKKIKQAYCSIKYKKLSSDIWSSKHVEQLVNSKYETKKIINKIAFIGYASSPSFMHQLDALLEKFQKDEIAIVTISIYERDRDPYFEEYTKKRGIDLLSINEVIDQKICYRIGIMIDPDISGMFYNQEKYIFGMHLIAEKTARMMFIFGASNWMFNKITSGAFDYIFVPGMYHKKKYDALEIDAEIFALGSPRFEKRNKNINSLKTELNLDNSKKNIVWLPTHTNVSSIPDFVDMVSLLRDRFNIILKPHDNMRLEINVENEILPKIPNCRIINNTVDSLDLINIADFVFCDYGGSVFSAIKLDKNVILFNTNELETLKKVFGMDTPEIEIRKDIINFNMNEREKFLSSLDDKYIWERQSERRSKIREEFFAGVDGKVGNEIVGALRKIINE